MTLLDALTLDFPGQVMGQVEKTPGADPTDNMLFEGSALMLNEANARQLFV